MTIKTKILRDRCDGFGNCVAAASDIFNLDDDGRVRAEVKDDRADIVRRAIYDCAASAIAHDEAQT